MPATTITISSDQRDGLYELVRNHLGSAGDLVDLLEQQKDWVKAEQLGLELAEDIRLMQDLGWNEDEGGDGIELTMPTHDQMEALNRLHGEAEVVLAGANPSPEDAETNQRFLRGLDACETVLVNLDSSASERA
ncbi:MAG: hypothetical protein WA862_10955 [Solirubrobacterales bacterium]